jgi:hypothetical protein
MRHLQKRLIIIVALVIAIPCVELLREYIVYLHISSKLDNAAQQIKPNMTKDDVEILAGKPDDIYKYEQQEFWNWGAGDHQGYLWKLLGLTRVKGHTTLSVEFNDQDKVLRSWGGIN